MKQKLLYLLVVGASIVLLLFVISSSFIGYEVKTKCVQARDRYGGDCVEALSRVVDDESSSFSSRNSAVWALGQLGDARGLSVLEKYYTGNIPTRESWNGTLSQYELKKAIKLVSGGFNITAVAWRGSPTL